MSKTIFSGMAIFHLTTKNISRSAGQSAVAKAAYNARNCLTDERTGELRDYSRKEGLLFSGIFAPKNAPEWAHDRAELWNQAEAAETRKNARTAREIEIALPHELTDEQRRYLVQDFVREQFVRRGMVADVCIHAPDRTGDGRNYHAHILLTTREIGPEGFTGKNRDWNKAETLEAWREAWERTANRHLERHGHEARIDRRTLKAQGIDREPTRHLGPQAVAMQRRGLEPNRYAELKEIEARNQQRAELSAALGEVRREIARETAKGWNREEGPRLSGRFRSPNRYAELRRLNGEAKEDRESQAPPSEQTTKTRLIFFDADEHTWER